MKTWLALACTATAIFASAAQAQSAGPGVWRCGADGRSYGDTPCPGGTELAVADPRTASQTQAARELAQREAGLAERMAREREQRERQALARLAPQPASRNAAPRKDAAQGANAQSAQRKAAQKLKRQAPADDGTWRAIVPVSRPTKG